MIDVIALDTKELIEFEDIQVQFVDLTIEEFYKGNFYEEVLQDKSLRYEVLLPKVLLEIDGMSPAEFDISNCSITQKKMVTFHYNKALIKIFSTLTKNQLTSFFYHQIVKPKDPLEWLYSVERMISTLIFEESDPEKQKTKNLYIKRDIFWPIPIEDVKIANYNATGHITKEISDNVQKNIDSLIENYLPKKPIPDINKINSTLSVPDLSILINLLREVNIFTNTKESLYRICNLVFSCLETDEPSSDYMRNSWNKVEVKHLEKWKKILYKVITRINKLIEEKNNNFSKRKSRS